MHGRHKAMGISMDSLQQICIMQTKIACALISGVLVYGYVSLVDYTPLTTNIADLENPIFPAIYCAIMSYMFASVIFLFLFKYF